MNAMEHGNHFKCELPVLIRVLASPAALAVRITDQGGGAAIPEPRMPDLEAKVAGQETARGWGLPLIQKLVDEMQTSGDVHQHTLQLVMHLEGDKDAGKPA